jgi:hypothetical protein
MTTPTYGQAIPAPNTGTTAPTKPEPVKGFTCLLQGDIGTGKTTALRTLIDAGITPFIIATEPGIAAILGDLPKGSYHIANHLPGNQNWTDMLANARLMNSTTLKAIAEMGDVKKNKFQQYMGIIETCANFKCEVTGESFGPVDSFSTDRALCLDTLSGFNRICMQFVIGAKPVASQLDWQVAQNINMAMIQTILANCLCHVVVNAHIDRELDEVLGGTKIMASSLGRKLAPLLPRDFDNVILAEVDREGKHTWSTTPGAALLKSRHLPRGDKLSPSFVPMLEAWKKTGGIILPTNPKV